MMDRENSHCPAVEGGANVSVVCRGSSHIAPHNDALDSAAGGQGKSSFQNQPHRHRELGILARVRHGSPAFAIRCGDISTRAEGFEVTAHAEATFARKMRHGGSPVQGASNHTADIVRIVSGVLHL
eukprot:CAMPEP_0172641032 /NCGR_PEP_ID=MMETSP1068-20121228/225413_1 /TAXON_ID=35684 /ORGANISM="Pseudopedinella elastica, Strain CCMP716" /LENGTH=125 /DNA_ID=CAMNT_0013454525 /DNA_START=371 /DNA_END=748 /DNA_ORIENTATION=-